MGANNYSSDQWDDSDSGGQPCATGRHCAEADYAGNPQRGPRAFCDTDRGRIGTVIRDLPQTYVDVHFKLGKAGQQDGERVTGGGKEAPVPIDLDIEAFLRHMIRVAVSWERLVREAADLPDPDRCQACKGRGEDKDGRDCRACDGYGTAGVRDGAALSRACRLLAGPDRERTGHLSTLLALPPVDVLRPVKGSVRLSELEPGSVVRIDSSGDAWQLKAVDGTGAGLEFLALGGTARSMLGLTPRRQRIPLRCDGCQGLTLVQREALAGDWEPIVRCTACPQMYAGTDYDDLVTRWWKAGDQAAKAS